jgi:hypothetical protein
MYRPSAENIVKIRVALCNLQEISYKFPARVGRIGNFSVFVGNCAAPPSDFPT